MDKTTTVLVIMYSSFGLNILGTIAMAITVMLEKRQKHRQEHFKEALA